MSIFMKKKKLTLSTESRVMSEYNTTGSQCRVIVGLESNGNQSQVVQCGSLPATRGKLIYAFTKIG